MVDTRKISAEALVDIVYKVQGRTGYLFDLGDIFDIVKHTVRKAELTGQDESYVPLLLETALEDFVMRKRINLMGVMNKCAKCAG